MPTGKLNPFAQEWQPPAPIETQIGGLKLSLAASAKQRNGSDRQTGSAFSHGSQAGPSYANQLSDGAELEFEDVFERNGSTAGRDGATDSLSSSSRSGLKGPTPLPSPASSPLTSTSLLAATEAEESGSASLPGPHVAAIPVIAATTHAATAASAELASTSGKTRYGPTDFDMLSVVGQGAFGKVFQVRKKDTGEIFAMKVMRKDSILEKDHGDYVRAERNILTSVLHPYIVTLRYSFQTPHKLYLVLDFINGGHLFFQLYRQGTFDEPLARLYTAEIVLAITHLHSLGFVHRDLKPENVLLDSEGHIRVSDFGLAKGKMHEEEQRSNSFIGTMEYMAPEIINGRGHGKSADWWSVGVLLYEMLCGVAPFRAKGRNALQKLITTGKPKFPTYLSTPALSLLKGLLQKDATKRLGYGPGGSAEIQSHPFFRGIEWRLLEQRKVPSPFKPSVSGGKSSVENFDKIWTDLPVQVGLPLPHPRDGSQLTAMEGMFEGFSYVAPSFLGDVVGADDLHRMSSIPE